VIRRANVSRSAVYRVWPTKEEFNLELLETLAAPSWMGAAALDEETLRLAREVVLSRPERLGSAEGRRTALLEAVRLAAWQNFDSLVGKPAWRTFVVLSLTLPSVPAGERRDGLAARLRDSDALFSNTMADFYRQMLPILGLRPKPPFTEENVYQFLAKVGGALVEGLGIHHGLDPGLSAQRFGGPGGEWSPPAIGFLAIIDALTEPDPDFQPPRINDRGDLKP
jgi:AcrR family transcriptional regulator